MLNHPHSPKVDSNMSLTIQSIYMSKVNATQQPLSRLEERREKKQYSCSYRQLHSTDIEANPITQKSHSCSSKNKPAPRILNINLPTESFKFTTQCESHSIKKKNKKKPTDLLQLNVDAVNISVHTLHQHHQLC